MAMMKRIQIAWAASICLSIAALSCSGADSQAGKESQESAGQLDPRMEWWREARFGMFIHWGLYSQAAGEWNGKTTSGAGEWIMNDMKIPLSKYASLESQFNPVQFDARQWVHIAKDAGMKYMVITSKHHEGFGIFRSSLTDWCIKSTPFQRDPLKELAAACQDQDMKLGFYHSIMDWHHPDYAPRKSWNDIDTAPPDFDRYVTYMKGQLKELLTGYGPVAVLWFDGQWENTWNPVRGADLYEYVRGLQPNIIVNDRVAGGGPRAAQHRYGDYITPEQTIPANGLGAGVDWETCMTMNDTWGFKKSDNDWKPTKTLVRNLIDCASKGGNYLLNVGPTSEGLIPEASIERLSEIGRWLRANGEAIYGTTASPFSHPLSWGRCTKKAGADMTILYLHVFDWPANGELVLPGLLNQPKSANLLANLDTPVKAEKRDNNLVVVLPKSASVDPIATTIVLRIIGEPQVEPTTISQQSDGTITLPASEARLHGNTLQYESGGQRDNIGYWMVPSDWVDWEFKVTKPGKFKVSAEIAAQGSGSFEISAGGQTLRCNAPKTGDYVAFTRVDLGTLELQIPGKAILGVHPISDGWQPMNLKSIRLEPVDTGR
jgi:alpha-L-fucosidase